MYHPGNAKLLKQGWLGFFRLNIVVFSCAFLAQFFALVVLPPSARGADDSGISANPGAVNVIAGTGRLGRLVGIGKDSGVQIGGVWLGDVNYLFSGGVKPGDWSSNSLLILDFNLDLDKRLKIPGAQFGTEFLQFNGEGTNAEAGVISGYNSLPGLPPLDRSELYQLWWRQQFLAEKLILRVGKTVPTNDFNNVNRPVQVRDLTLAIPAVSGLGFTPLFVNPTLLGVMPGYYNSAYGITTTLAPTKNAYLSYGLYDGAGARGVQTGLRATPSFGGYFFNIGEMGYAWLLGSQKKPGSFAVGGWDETGKMSAGSLHEDGAQGFYTFASQRLWFRSPGADNSGITSFFQFGTNGSKTMIAKKYVGGGLTGFGLVPKRPKDSLGAGVGVSWLNENLGFRSNEAILQAYYQMHVVSDIYFQPTMTYVPNPGQSRDLSAATALTMRVTFLF